MFFWPLHVTALVQIHKHVANDPRMYLSSGSPPTVAQPRVPRHSPIHCHGIGELRFRLDLVRDVDYITNVRRQEFLQYVSLTFSPFPVGLNFVQLQSFICDTEHFFLGSHSSTEESTEERAERVHAYRKIWKRIPKHWC